MKTGKIKKTWRHANSVERRTRKSCANRTERTDRVSLNRPDRENLNSGPVGHIIALINGISETVKCF